MSQPSILKEIACPNCGSPLQQHLSTTQTIICPTCGNHIAVGAGDPQILGEGSRPRRSPVPIELGQTATLRGTGFFVMGHVVYEGWDDEDRWTWHEWLLGGDDGRLLWLSYDEKGFSLYQKVRLRQPIDLNSRRINIGDRAMMVHERYPAMITGAEGELTWQARQGETLQMVEGAGQGKRYSIQQSAEELEVYEGDPLREEELAQAFGNARWQAQIRRRSNTTRLLRTIGVICIVFALLGLLGAGVASAAGERLVSQNATLSRANPTVIFPVVFDVAERPAEVSIRLEGTLPENTYLEIDVNVVSPDGTETYLFLQEFWHETGTDDEGFWREFDYEATDMFVPTLVGDHEIELALGDTPVDSISATVSIQRNRIMASWYIAYAVIVGVVGGGLLFLSVRRAGR